MMITDDTKQAIDSEIFDGGLWKDHPLYPRIKSDLEAFDMGEIRKRQLIHNIAAVMVENYNLVKPKSKEIGWGRSIWWYDPGKGIYRPGGEEYVSSQVRRLVGGVFSSTDISEVVDTVEDYALKSARWFNVPDNHLVVENGILDVVTGELYPHTPDEPHKTCIDVAWPDDPQAATCESIDEFFHSLVDGSDVNTLYRLIAHTLYKGYPSSKAAMLAGDGANGKSTFLAFVRRFLHPGRDISPGEDVHRNVSSRSLQEIANDDWAASDLSGTLANIDSDMDDNAVNRTNTFKKATGGKDTLNANQKYKEVYKFVNHATLMFAVNSVPMSEDDTDAFWRRWIYINFPNVFREGSAEYIDEDELLDRITTDGELSGLLVRCVEELQRWDETDVFYPDIPGEEIVREEMKKASDSVYAFANDCLVDADDSDEMVPKEVLRAGYSKYCQAENVPTVAPSVFGKRILNMSDITVEEGRSRQTEFNGTTPVYRGVAWTSRGQQIMDDSGGGDDSQQTGLEQSAEQSNASVTNAAAKATHIARTEGPLSQSEILIHLVDDEEMSASKATAGIEKALERGDIIDRGDEIIAG